MPNLNYEPTSDLGEFYTPVRVSKSLRTLTASVLGDNFENEYVIWDCCCGHFALTHELNILDDSNLYCSTLRAEDIDGFQEEKGIKFQYDFLNDDVEKLLDTSEFMFGEYKMPSGLLDTLNNPNGKPILFYINPPYGSKNKGLSTIAWLHRCMELCKQESSGCLVIPYDENVLWTVEAMRNIQDFLIKLLEVMKEEF